MNEYIFYPRNSLRNPKFIAHRGYTVLAPENSMPAFIEAAKRGMWAVETDVWKTADGVLVCCHDRSLERTFGVTLNVDEAKFEELTRFKITNGNNVDRYPDNLLRIPKFDEYIQICRDYGCVPFIETKGDVVFDVICILRDYGMEEYSVISSSNFQHLLETREYSKKVFVHHIFSSETMINDVSNLGYSGMAFDYTNMADVSDDLVKEVHRANVKICFRAADDTKTAIEMIKKGVDYIPTNLIYTI
jgi:glycerophosphoryl diester phosphodiesterase